MYSNQQKVAVCSSFFVVVGIFCLIFYDFSSKKKQQTSIEALILVASLKTDKNWEVTASRNFIVNEKLQMAVHRKGSVWQWNHRFDEDKRGPCLTFFTCSELNLFSKLFSTVEKRIFVNRFDHK